MDEREAADAWRRWEEQRDALHLWKRDMNELILKASGYRQTGDPDDVGLMSAISVEESMWLREACDGIE